jgi:signal transduction histidine kinase
MESALERAHFSAKVQHAEQLATVGLLGASLAHEIRNPLVSIKTFVQLLPTHYQDARFREKFFHLIGSEVTRIDQLTEQLLDLASPRTYAAARCMRCTRFCNPASNSWRPKRQTKRCS